jgi:hypothetical protein
VVGGDAGGGGEYYRPLLSHTQNTRIPTVEWELFCDKAFVAEWRSESPRISITTGRMGTFHTFDDWATFVAESTLL